MNVINSVRLKFLVPLLLGAAVFVLWRFVYPCALAYHEQMQLFLWSSDYAVMRIVEPGGVARYIAEFIVQFYNNFLVGALLLALLYVAIQQLSYRIACRFVDDSRQPVALSLLVPSLLLFVMANADVMTTFAVAYMLSLFVIAFVPLKGKASAVCIFVALPLLYWLIGPVVFFICIYMTLAWLMTWQSHGKALLAGGALMVFAVACILLSQYVTYYPVSRLLRGVDYFRYPLNTVPYCWLLVLPALFPLLVMTKRWKHRVLAGELAALTVTVAIMPLAFDKIVYEQMEYNLLVRMQRWDMILDKANRNHPEGNASKLAVNLALFKAHVISIQELMTRTRMVEFNDSKTMAGILNETFFHLGMVNYVQRFAFEQMELIPNYNKSGRQMKRLAEASLVSGNYRLTRKYLAILSLAPFYRSWAADIERLLDSPTLLEQHPVYAPLMHSFPKNDELMM